METTTIQGLYRGIWGGYCAYSGITEKKMEITI